MVRNGYLTRNVTKRDGVPSGELRDVMPRMQSHDVRGPFRTTEGRIYLLQGRVRPLPRCPASRYTIFPALEQINSGQMVHIKRKAL